MNGKIKIGISSCLIGKKVRFDGRDKNQPSIVESLAEQFLLIPTCPEMEAGMTTPREPVRLVRQDGELTVIGLSGGTDWTPAILKVIREKIEQDHADRLCGYILKSGSPSCGLEAVPVFAKSELPDLSELVEISKQGVGLFAAAIKNSFPGMPVCDELWLSDPNNLDSFISAVRRFASHSQHIETS